MIWSGHNFAHAMTAELSWHVQSCDLFESVELEWIKFSLTFNFEPMQNDFQPLFTVLGEAYFLFIFFQIFF